MAGRSRKFAEALGAAMLEFGDGRRMLPLREAGRLTGVSYNLINTILKYEHIPQPDNVRKLAHGFGRDEKEWLALCGYDAEPERTEHEAREVDASVSRILQHWDNVPPSRKPLAEQAVIGLLAGLSR